MPLISTGPALVLKLGERIFADALIELPVRKPGSGRITGYSSPTRFPSFPECRAATCQGWGRMAHNPDATLMEGRAKYPTEDYGQSYLKDCNLLSDPSWPTFSSSA